MNKLDTYLKQGRKAKDLAKAIGRSQSFVSELRKNTRKPSWATMRAIHDATNGEVSFADWQEDVT